MPSPLEYLGRSAVTRGVYATVDGAQQIGGDNAVSSGVRTMRAAMRVGSSWAEAQLRAHVHPAGDRVVHREPNRSESATPHRPSITRERNRNKPKHPENQFRLQSIPWHAHAGPKELAGQLLTLGFEGLELSAEVRSMLKTLQPGGIILFTRNIESPGRLTPC